MAKSKATIKKNSSCQDIDSIFASKKGKVKIEKPKKQAAKSEDSLSASKRKAEKLKKDVENSPEKAVKKGIKYVASDALDFSDAQGKHRTTRRLTEDGFPIYTPAELGVTVAQGGDTDLCPFDCACCF